MTLAGYFLGQIAWIRDNVDLIFIFAAVVVVLAAAAPAVLHWRQRRKTAVTPRDSSDRRGACRLPDRPGPGRRPDPRGAGAPDPAS